MQTNCQVTEKHRSTTEKSRIEHASVLETSDEPTKQEKENGRHGLGLVTLLSWQNIISLCRWIVGLDNANLFLVDILPSVDHQFKKAHGNTLNYIDSLNLISGR